MQKITGTIASPKGFHADGIHCGLKKKRKDIGWIYSDAPASVAGVFTTNKVQAAPVKWNKKIVAGGTCQALVVNSGNANACTGPKGHEDTEKMASLVASKLGITKDLVAVSSTGIIGQAMPMETIAEGIDGLRKDGEAEAFAEAILTTDTVTKEITVREDFGGATVTMSGVAKGSGMIHPNMATMLGYITTDAVIGSETLQKMLKELTEVTFNQITIDGDTSTNDTVLVMANGKAKTEPITKDTEDYDKFKAMLYLVMETLAKKIAQDGEGATKLIEVTALGAEDAASARMIAKSIVGSSLTKAAVFGKDPNWGRIICAAGYAGADFDPELVSISLMGIPVFADGAPVSYDEAEIESKLAEDTIFIMIDLNQGKASGKAWGCDLTYDYVKINALYST